MSRLHYWCWCHTSSSWRGLDMNDAPLSLRLSRLSYDQMNGFEPKCLHTFWGWKKNNCELQVFVHQFMRKCEALNALHLHVMFLWMIRLGPHLMWPFFVKLPACLTTIGPTFGWIYYHRWLLGRLPGYIDSKLKNYHCFNEFASQKRALAPSWRQKKHPESKSKWEFRGCGGGWCRCRHCLGCDWRPGQFVRMCVIEGHWAFEA